MGGTNPEERTMGNTFLSFEARQKQCISWSFGDVNKLGRMKNCFSSKQEPMESPGFALSVSLSRSLSLFLSIIQVTVHFLGNQLINLIANSAVVTKQFLILPNYCSSSCLKCFIILIHPARWDLLKQIYFSDEDSFQVSANAQKIPNAGRLFLQWHFRMVCFFYNSNK